MRPLLALLCLLCFPYPPVLHASDAAAPARTPWQMALGFEYNEAAENFDRLQAVSPADARIAIARAATLLVRQPRTADNIRTARSLLEAVAMRSATFAGASVDETVLAAYLAARIDQDHLEPPRLAMARAAYETILRDHPGHRLAGQAAVQLSLLDAWGEPRLSPAGAIARITARLPGAAPHPEAARELYFILARLEWEGCRNAHAAVAHLQAGRAIGYESPFRNAEVDLMIANLARGVNDKTTAIAHYRAFLEGKRRDIRASTVRRYLAELEQEEHLREAVGIVMP
ncbi:hypothetical protein OPIT5_05935 [Opitutaceae bacterium TAV5]|nr:hypothetical protein OPIT5_05935 [Opitutaceae bacterium TAV5]